MKCNAYSFFKSDPELKWVSFLKPDQMLTLSHSDDGMEENDQRVESNFFQCGEDFLKPDPFLTLSDSGLQDQQDLYESTAFFKERKNNNGDLSQTELFKQENKNC